MAKQRLTDIQQMSEAIHDSDVLHIVDISDTEDSAEGSSRKVTIEQLKEVFGVVQSFSENFLVADWVLDGDIYRLDIVHSLNCTNPVVEIREDGAIIQVNSIENVDTDTIRIRVPSTPDLRFDGTISVVKITE